MFYIIYVWSVCCCIEWFEWFQFIIFYSYSNKLRCSFIRMKWKSRGVINTGYRNINSQILNLPLMSAHVNYNLTRFSCFVICPAGRPCRSRTSSRKRLLLDNANLRMPTNEKNHMVCLNHENILKHVWMVLI